MTFFPRSSDIACSTALPPGQTAATMTNNGGNETPLSLGPQEWQWYLQEKDLIPSDVTLELGTAIKRIDFLPPTATVVCRHAFDESDMNTSITVAQGLLVATPSLLSRYISFGKSSAGSTIA